jgi:hypothetical protein
VNFQYQFGPDQEKMEQAIKRWRESGDGVADLHFASESRRQELLRRLNHAPGAIADLVRMREQLLEELSSRPALRVVQLRDCQLEMIMAATSRNIRTRASWTTRPRIKGIKFGDQASQLMPLCANARKIVDTAM